MEKENTTQAESKTRSIHHTSGTSHHRRRRSKRRSGSKLKKYFEWLMWTAVAGGFLYVIYMLASSASFRDKDAVQTKKTSLLKMVIEAPVS
ncbi:MAG: hypothetical protein ACHQNT_04315 [Bacteroidia bacterium]